MTEYEGYSFEYPRNSIFSVGVIPCIEMVDCLHYASEGIVHEKPYEYVKDYCPCKEPESPLPVIVEVLPQAGYDK